MSNEYRFDLWNRPFRLNSELYYKDLDDLNTYTIDNVRIRYVANNNAFGYAYGLDLRLNGEFVKGTESWFSFGYLKTEENIDNRGYISRPTDQRLKFGVLFQDYVPNMPNLKMFINLIYNTGLPGGSPSYADPYEYQNRLPDYKRADIGIMYLIEDAKKLGINADGPLPCDTSFITTSPDALDFKIKNSFYMPNPCDVSLDYLKNFNRSNDFDLFYAISHGVHRGNLRPGKKDERELFISKLKRKNLGIKFDTYGMFGVQPVWGNDFLNRLSNSNMALNLSRGKPIKYYSSDRIAQIMGNGLLTLVDEKVCLTDFFTKKEIVTYKNYSDLIEKIKKYLRDDKERKSIAKNGKTKYLKHFNSEKVAKFIINKTLNINEKEKFLWQ